MGLKTFWKKMGGKDLVNDAVDKLISRTEKAAPIILKKYFNEQTATSITKEIIAEMRKAKDKIW